MYLNPHSYAHTYYIFKCSHGLVVGELRLSSEGLRFESKIQQAMIDEPLSKKNEPLTASWGALAVCRKPRDEKNIHQKRYLHCYNRYNNNRCLLLHFNNGNYEFD